jgi:hypothetical protein
VKLKIVAILALLGCLAFAASADAFKYRMRYGQAKHESLTYVKRLCAEIPECTGYGTGQCYRRSLSRFDCMVGIFSEGAEYGEEIECDQMLHWGVSLSGYVSLKNSGEPYCYIR